jgi:hypothetical protein
MPFAAAAVAAAAVGVGTSILSANSQADAISKGQAQADARLAPFATGGTTAFNAEGDLTGINGPAAATTAMGNFTASPGYQYQVSQGLRAVDNGAAARGILRSGATLKAEQTLGTNLANQDFTGYVGRLNSLATIGANAATGQASVDTNAAGAQAKITGQEFSNINSSVNTGLSGLSGGGGLSGQNSLASLFGNGAPIAGQPSDFGNQTVNTSGFGNATGGNSS